MNGMCCSCCKCTNEEAKQCQGESCSCAIDVPTDVARFLNSFQQCDADERAEIRRIIADMTELSNELQDIYTSSIQSSIVVPGMTKSVARKLRKRVSGWKAVLQELI